MNWDNGTVAREMSLLPRRPGPGSQHLKEHHLSLSGVTRSFRAVSIRALAPTA